MYKKIHQQQKAGSFSNVATIRINDDEVTWVEENVNDILVRQENQYKDWLCWAGIESLMIDSIGDVYVATCRAKKLGNIYSDFEMLINPIICPKSWCTCAADINTSKVKDKKYLTYLRVNKNDS